MLISKQRVLFGEEYVLLKKFVKMLVTVTAGIAVVLSVTSLASAASPIRLTCGDKVLNVSPVLMQDGRSYAAYDTLFKALGVRAGYNKASRTITATSDGVTVVIPLDDSYITVYAEGGEYDMYVRAMPIENTVSGRIYVPIRYAAQAFGYDVTWDSGTRTIMLRRLDDLITQSGATYTVMDRILKYYIDFAGKGHAFKGTFEATMSMGMGYGDGEEPAAPEQMTLSGAASGLSDPFGEEMSLNLKTNMSDFDSYMSGDESLTDEEKTKLEQYDNLDINLIINKETGMIYVKSPLYSVIADAPEDAWISMASEDSGSMSVMSELLNCGLSGIGLTDVQNAGGSFRDYVKEKLRYQLLEGSGSAAQTLEGINALFSDQAMVKDGDNYVVAYAESYGDPGGSDYGFSSDNSLQLIFSFNGETFTGLSVTQSSSHSSNYYYGEDKYTSQTEYTYAYTTTGVGKLSYRNTVNGDDAVSLSVDFTFTETSQTPARQPAEGSTVIPAEELYTYGSTEEIETDNAA